MTKIPDIQPFSDHDAVSLKIKVTKEKPKGLNYWKLTTKHKKHLKKPFKIFGQIGNNNKKKYRSLNHWWELGKIYFKIVTIQHSKEKNQNLNKKQETLIQQINNEKNKALPNHNKIKKWQEDLNDIENYKTHGSIIKCKEK